MWPCLEAVLSSGIGCVWPHLQAVLIITASGLGRGWEKPGILWNISQSTGQPLWSSGTWPGQLSTRLKILLKWSVLMLHRRSVWRARASARFFLACSLNCTYLSMRLKHSALGLVALEQLSEEWNFKELTCSSFLLFRTRPGCSVRILSLCLWRFSALWFHCCLTSLISPLIPVD